MPVLRHGMIIRDARVPHLCSKQITNCVYHCVSTERDRERPATGLCGTGRDRHKLASSRQRVTFATVRHRSPPLLQRISFFASLPRYRYILYRRHQIFDRYQSPSISLKISTLSLIVSSRRITPRCRCVSCVGCIQ